MESEKQDVAVDGNQQNSVEEAKENEIAAFPISIKTIGENKVTLPLQITAMDNMQDIRQYLFESIDTCYITNYNLTVEGTKLNDFVEIGEVSDFVKANATLEMVESPYDDRSIRLHVRRLRDILVSNYDSSKSTALYSQLSKPYETDNAVPPTKKETTTTTEQQTIKDSDIPTDSGVSLLSTFYPASLHDKNQFIQCVKSITYSGYNPPPGYRKLQGDLIYLEIQTLENKSYHVTGWSKGFYVNLSNNSTFNPIAADKAYRSHNLVNLLNQISPLFKKNFANVLQLTFQRHPYESFPVPFPVIPWIQKKEKHVIDNNRAEESLIMDNDIEYRGQLRDWNEEYQSCKELPKETIQERIVRERAIVKVNADFVEAATKGAIAIVEKTVLPINPLDNEKAHMFIYNNIFFSYALDGRDLFKDFGGDNAAFVSVKNDLKGIQLLNKIDIKGIYTLATCIIDYKGNRIVAQSIIPGILQREQTSNVVYGSIDNGKSINNDNSFHDLLKEAAKQLHIREHKVKDSTGKIVDLVTSVESKGIIGTDTRKYILDLIRLTPRDANQIGNNHFFSVLRPELVATYYDHLKQLEIIKKKQEKQKEKEAEKAAAAGTTEKATTETNNEKKEEQKEQENKEEQKEEEEVEEEEEEIEINIEFEGFNPNALCNYELVGDLESEEKVTKEMSKFLIETIIPSFIEELIWVLPLPVDGTTLTKLMHNHGINLRYLGKLATITDKIPVVNQILIREMIVRSVKHILNNIIRTTPDYEVSLVITHVFNCLFGNIGGKLTKKQEENNNNEDVFSMTTNSLWNKIVNEVKQRYDFELPNRETIKNNVIKTNATLRGVCIKVGIQIDAKDYDFTNEKPFEINDILNLIPIVKHVEPQSNDGVNLLEAGKTYLNQGRLDIAYELLTEALVIFHQVYGPMHKETAMCYMNLGTVLYHAKDLKQALEHQEKATIIFERVLGIDHYETAHSYMTLSLLSHSAGKHTLALQYIIHSLYIVRLLGGNGHPDTANIYINMAQMLQEMQRHKLAIQYYLKSLQSYEQLIGTATLQTASIYHAIALAYSQIGEFKEALVFEKKNYAILHEKVGDDDLRTVESNICLKQFTAKAVQAQIETKKTQRDITSGLTKEKLAKLRSGAGGLSIPQPGKSTSLGGASTINTPMGNRPLNEVLAFINDSAKQRKSFSERNVKSGLGGNIGIKKTKKKVSGKDVPE